MRYAFFVNILMNQPPRVLLLIPHLGGGGAEQVTALLARGLSASKYDLHLGLATGAAEAAAGIPSSVTLHALGSRRVRASGFRLLRLVRKLRPDIILCGMAHLNFLVLLLRPFFPARTRVVVRQNTTVSSALAFGAPPPYTRLLYRLLYRHADRVICQSRAMADDLAAQVGLHADLISVLPNPIDFAGIRAAEHVTELWAGPGPHLLAVGRLSSEKGLDLLLSALPAVRDQFPSVNLLILGKGAEQAALTSLSRQLGLEGAVHFAGHVANPYIYFAGATLFVLPSRHEGMPNALLEAAAAGLPLVALPASGGLLDLMRNRPGAWLADDISAESLAAALLKALIALESGQRFSHRF